MPVAGDNGKGFSEQDLRSFGNDLAGMKRRMEEMGGQCEVDSQPGRGTRVAVRPKANS
jgi:signal transduction histidine kinase